MIPLRISVSFLLISLVIIMPAAATDNIRSDVNGNGLVEMGDLTSINEHLNEAVSEPYPPYDVKMDGTVNVLDNLKNPEETYMY
jgi:Dockerin type I domain